jgi:hypothetical protein
MQGAEDPVGDDPIEAPPGHFLDDEPEEPPERPSEASVRSARMYVGLSTLDPRPSTLDGSAVA